MVDDPADHRMIAAALDVGIPPFIEYNGTAEHCKHEVQLL